MKLTEDNINKISPIKKLSILEQNIRGLSEAKEGELKNWYWNIGNEVGLVIK